METVEIPADIAATAWSLVCGSGCIIDVCSLPGCGCFDKIAAALLAERERCAKIAERRFALATDAAPEAAWALFAALPDGIRT